ncbi:MAG: hypothetical protein OSB09_06895 [Planctomycetota bacterium]|nr:hypothetical protein [Planctomycetota bacterium]
MSATWILISMLSVIPLGGQDDQVVELRPQELLADLDHPDRWRWIPEERMPLGNVFERVLVSSFITPVVFFEGDVGAGGGLGITDIDFLNQRRSQFASIWATYTSEGQRHYSISWLKWLSHRDEPGRGVLQGDRDFLGLSVNHSKTLTSRFFGLGADTTLPDEASYSRKTNSLQFEIQRSLPKNDGDWIWNLAGTLQSDELASGRVTGALDVADEHPLLFSEGDGYDALWFQAGLRHDTRDAQHLPYQGHSIGVSILTIPLVSSREGGAIASLKANWIRPVTPLFHDGGDMNLDHPPIDSCAAYFSLSSSIGEIPFWALPTLGGDHTLRGTIRGRWRDRCAWATGVEWRPWVVEDGFALAWDLRIERAGLALFADAGSVAPELGALLDAAVHSSIGVGARFTFERQALFRVDLGWSDEGDTNLSISYGLPF